MKNSSPKYCLCGNVIGDARYNLGIYVCLYCGEEKALARKEWLSNATVALHKSNYILITNKDDLKNLDPKHKN